MSSVFLDRVSKHYSGDGGSLAVDEVTLEVKDREFLVLVGPSGCGKSTTLRLIAGLEASTGGEIRIGNRVVNDVAPKDRDIAMVFQNYALYPHMSVYRNMSFGLTLRFGGGVLARGLRKIFRPRRSAELSAKRAGIDHQVRQAANRLSITHLLDRKPHQLSGGERQRVALGRAIVRNPAVFLFDEPLSNLDANLRQQMRVELKRLHRQLQTTMIYVTHDQVEAMTLGDRVAVMNGGKIQQLGRPLEIYQQPANLFVAQFVGNVPINLRQGTIWLENQQVMFDDGSLRLAFATSQLGETNVNRLFSGTETLNAADDGVSDGLSHSLRREVVLGFRAEDVTVARGSDSGNANALAEVVATDQLGESILVHMELLPREPATSNSTGASVKPRNLQFGQFETNDRLVLARLSPDQADSASDRVSVTVRPQRLNWFDPATGQNLLKDKT